MRPLCPALLLASLLLAACTAVRSVNMDWMPVEGNRQAGRIALSIMWNPRHDRPALDVWRAQAVAQERCLAWGYASAVQEGEMESRCTRHESGMLGICIRKEATLHFRCTGADRPALP